MMNKNRNSKPHLEEKFVHMYKEIFSGNSLIHTKKDSGIKGHAALTRFWDELLLLKVNEGFLSQCISNLSELQLKANMKLVLNDLFGTCSLYLDDENFIRVAHALETLIILFQEIFKKNFSEKGLTIISLIAGSVENADSYFMKLINRVSNLLKRDDVPIPVKSLCLRLYFTMLTTTDNINTNVVGSYFLENSIMSAILAVLTVKLSEDRRCLELDAALIVILLLLWRESENIYVDFLYHQSSPLLPFIQTAHSLMAYVKHPEEEPLLSSSSQIWSVTSSLYGLLGNFLGVSSASVENQSTISVNTNLSTQEDCWLHTTAGVILAYSVMYHCNPARLNQYWPTSSNADIGGHGSMMQSMVLSWIELVKAFVSLCRRSAVELAKAGAAEVLQVKCCLILLRCFLESKEAFDYFALTDIESFTFKISPGGLSGLPVSISRKNIICVILDCIATILNTTPNALLDPDLFCRASVLVPLIFNSLKGRGWQLSSENNGWAHLWKGLIQLCNWAGDKNNSQKVGISELSELVVGTIESCLGNSHDVFSAAEESERLHAMIMVHYNNLNTTLESITSINKSSAQQANITMVKLHYDIQIAASGVRGSPTFEQALQGVQKKGMLNIKLKPKHAGPSHSYVEGTTEHRLLINAARCLVALRRKQASMKSHSIEVSILDHRNV